MSQAIKPAKAGHSPARAKRSGALAARKNLSREECAERVDSNAVTRRGVAQRSTLSAQGKFFRCRRVERPGAGFTQKGHAGIVISAIDKGGGHKGYPLQLSHHQKTGSANLKPENAKHRSTNSPRVAKQNKKAGDTLLPGMAPEGGYAGEEGGKDNSETFAAQDAPFENGSVSGCDREAGYVKERVRTLRLLFEPQQLTPVANPWKEGRRGLPETANPARECMIMNGAGHGGEL